MGDIASQIQKRLKKYSHLSELFLDDIPPQPQMEASIYRNEKVEAIWGKRFTIWSVLLHDDPRSAK